MPATPTADSAGAAGLGELFELELLSGGIERRYRRMRPEVERMPWGTFDLSSLVEADRVAARRAWTGAAFQEYRTALACAATLQALIEARAPLDLIALASRFPLDEMVHVELCARMAMELGGGTERVYDPSGMVCQADAGLPVLLRTADLVVRCFCVGEALSIPLLRGAWHAARQPLPRQILACIVRDEAAHGTFGFTFLDWALPALTEADRYHLAQAADSVITALAAQWADIRQQPQRDSHEADTLGWMQTDAYLALAERSLREKVVLPLRKRGIAVAGLGSSAPGAA